VLKSTEKNFYIFILTRGNNFLKKKPEVIKTPDFFSVEKNFILL